MHLFTIMPGVFLQPEGMKLGGLTPGQDTMLMFFAGVVTLAVVIQCFILIAFALAGIKARKELLNLGQQVHGEVMPLMSSFQSIAGETIREARKITANAIAVGEITRNRAVKLNALMTHLKEQAQNQAIHLDQIRTRACNGVNTSSRCVDGSSAS